MSGRGGDSIVLYGTLQRGQPAFVRLGLGRRLRFVSGATVAGRLVDLGAYPGFVFGDAIVTGQLFAILDGSVLSDLDAFEGFDPSRHARSLYIRERIAVIDPRRQAWIYRFNGSAAGRPEIGGGDWIAYRRRIR